MDYISSATPKGMQFGGIICSACNQTAHAVMETINQGPDGDETITRTYSHVQSQCVVTSPLPNFDWAALHRLRKASP